MQSDAKRLIRQNKKKLLSQLAETTRSALSPSQQRLFDISSERGSSSWLSVLPLKRHGFHLHKGAFRDGLCLRYGWAIPHLPTNCVCGAGFTVDHALNCPCGGYPSIRHNDIRDITASFMKEVCRDVAIEPILQPLSGETLQPRSAILEDSARSDIRAEGFWVNQQQAFFDVRVFNPSAVTYAKKPLQLAYRQLEAAKRRAYQSRIINIEHGSFAPLVFSTAGGMGPAATAVYRRLAALLATKRGELYSNTLLYIRCHLNFALIRSAVRCLRGSRSTYLPDIVNTDFNLALIESRVFE